MVGEHSTRHKTVSCLWFLKSKHSFECWGNMERRNDQSTPGLICVDTVLCHKLCSPPTAQCTYIRMTR